MPCFYCLQVQGTIEHFHDGCSDALTWLDKETYYTAFTEGWALYAENPLIALDTDTYEKEPMQKFGMLKWQVKCVYVVCKVKFAYKIRGQSGWGSSSVSECTEV